MSMEREEKLFLAIGGVEDRLIKEAGEPPRRPARTRWAAMAAAVALAAGVGIYGILPRMGGNGAASGVTGDEARPEGMTFLSYAGPVLPLTVVEGPDGLAADREVTWDFASAADAGQYTLYTAEVTDTTTIRNPGEETLAITVGYPVTADFRTAEEKLPILTVDGKATETGLLWGDNERDGESLWGARLESWDDVKALLADGSCLARSREEAPALDDTVTVWELLEETAPEVDRRKMAPTLAVDFRQDREKTQVWTWGFNGYSQPEDGTVRYDFFVRGEGERRQRRLLVFLGEVPEGCTIGGYQDGGCEKELEGVTARLVSFTTTLGELLDQLVAEEFSDWDSAQEIENRLDAFRGALRRMMAQHTAEELEAGGMLMLEDLFSHVLVQTRPVWTTAEVSIPAGGEVTVTARYRKEPSYDFVCADTERQGLLGWDLGTTLGSGLRFGEVTARVENAGRLEIVEQDFGFEPAGGSARVELDPGKEHYYMVVRIRERE